MPKTVFTESMTARFGSVRIEEGGLADGAEKVLINGANVLQSLPINLNNLGHGRLPGFGD